MARRWLSFILLAVALTGAGWSVAQSRPVSAQTEESTAEATAEPVAVEWNEWNTRIIVRADGSLDVVETQTITVTSGAIRFGARNFIEPVTLTAVDLTADGQPRRRLIEGFGVGTYQFTQDASGPVASYQLFETANTGDQFTVDLSYTVAPAVPGALDWTVVPQGHDFPVERSRATIFFADNLKPSAAQTATGGAQGHFFTFGKVIIVTAEGPIAASTPFEVNIPYQTDPHGTTF